MNQTIAAVPREAPKDPATACASCNPLVLVDGRPLRLRPLGPQDRDRLASLVAQLTPESRRRRFLSPKRELTARELVYFTDIDHVHHDAIAAVQRDGSFAGVAHYVHDGDRPGVATVALVVADDVQGMGLGTALTACTVQRARANGFTLLTATTLWENRPARAVLRHLGFRARATHGSEVDYELGLEQPGDQADTPGNPRTQPPGS